MQNFLSCNIKKLHEDAIIPKYATPGSAGFDLHSVAQYIVPPRALVMVHTGLAFSFPVGWEMQVRQRSGLSKVHPNYIAIGVGTIDQDYRGEIMIPVVNNDDYKWTIFTGDRIAQAVISPVTTAMFAVVSELDETKRGAGGFGHTG